MRVRLHRDPGTKQVGIALWVTDAELALVADRADVIAELILAVDDIGRDVLRAAAPKPTVEPTSPEVLELGWRVLQAVKNRRRQP